MLNPPPRIVLDLEKSRNGCSGLGQFARNLGRALTTEMSTRGLRPIPFVTAAQANDFGTSDAIEAKPWRKEIFQRWYRWTQMGRTPDYALWHATHQQAKYLPLNPKTRVLLTIHDLNYLREKKGAKIDREHRRVARLIRRADAITVISKFVAGEVKSYFDLQNKPLQVIYNGRPDVNQFVAHQPTWLNASRPYLFSIGIIDRKKNFHVLLDLIERLPNHQLVIAGQNHSEYAMEMRQIIQERNLADRVCLPGPISDEERQWLYENCESFVFPSLTEGFGLPPIEAMTVGKPVFLARRTSLPEIGGQRAFYWDDFAPEHMVDVYHRGMSVFNASPEYAQLLQQAAARFSWEDAARQYVDLYRSILQLEKVECFQPTLVAA